MYSLMTMSLQYVANALVSGLLTLVPIYMSVLLLHREMHSVSKLIHPISYSAESARAIAFKVHKHQRLGRRTQSTGGTVRL